MTLELHCDLCGKKVSSGRMMCGGPFNALCEPCRKTANKVIEAYLRMVADSPLRFFAHSIMSLSSKKYNESTKQPSNQKKHLTGAGSGLSVAKIEGCVRESEKEYKETTK